MKKGIAIDFSVHPTPMKPGDTVQTYHVRHAQSNVIHTRELRRHIAKHTMISEGLFDMVLDTLKQEIAEQLLMGKGVHLDGIGRFGLQLGTKKVQDEQGRWRTKVYTSPEQLTGDEVVVNGISFVPDKEMKMRLDGDSHPFVRDKREYKTEITLDQVKQPLTDYCQENGLFTRRVFQHMFGLSRYKADQMLTDLVNEENSPFFREKNGNSWIYRMKKD
jgi:nucleoid DNA-binding protein